MSLINKKIILKILLIIIFITKIYFTITNFIKNEIKNKIKNSKKIYKINTKIFKINTKIHKINTEFKKIKKINSYITKKIYLSNKYTVKIISNDCVLNDISNKLILCGNNDYDIYITLPNDDIKHQINMSCYLKNSFNKNVFINSKINICINGMNLINNEFIVRPFSLIKIILINKDYYLISKY